MTGARSSGGFTLVEVLVGTVMLTLLLLVLFGGMRTVFRTWDATEVVVQRNEQARQAFGFVARLLRDARQVRWRDFPALTARGAPDSAFAGEAGGLSFIGPGLPYLGLGGSMQYELYTEDAGGDGGRNLMIRLTPFRPDRTGVPGEPRLLLAGVRDLNLAYFGDREGLGSADWGDAWAGDKGNLPELVSLHVEFTDGRTEPDLVVAPLRTGGAQ